MKKSGLLLFVVAFCSLSYSSSVSTVCSDALVSSDNIYRAVWSCNSAMLYKSLSCGVDPDISDSNGTTLLIASASIGSGLLLICRTGQERVHSFTL
jgi:hypothetical protein